MAKHQAGHDKIISVQHELESDIVVIIKLVSVSSQQNPNQIRTFHDSTHASCMSVTWMSIGNMMSQPHSLFG